MAKLLCFFKNRKKVVLGALNKEIHLDFERRGWLLCDDVIRIKTRQMLAVGKTRWC